MPPELIIYLGLLLMGLAEFSAGAFMMRKAATITPEAAAKASNPLLQHPEWLKIFGAFLIMMGLLSLGLSFFVRP